VTHGILHIADNIEWTGPVWTSWCYPTERFCGKLQRAVKGRRNVYESINRNVLHWAQLGHIRLRFNLPLHFGLRVSVPDPGLSYEGDCKIPYI
jgi:hypothetical protein